MLRNVYSHSILLVMLIGCTSTSRTMTATSDNQSDCNLFAKEFEIDTISYKQFSSPLSEFFTSQNLFDLVILGMKGGHNDRSIFERWYLNGGKLIKLTVTEEGHIMDTINADIEKINDFVKIIESGEFLQICPYSSSNNSYLILIKVDSTLKFKYSSTQVDYSGLNDNERNKIRNVIELIRYLQGFNN